ncbi:MAG TPA: ABC transporter permease [Opitutaceae bacterium]|nr:ABC transporter permease [Opitutaceae bacterium]
MRLTNIFRVALRALSRNIMRSVLTALGIIIGIGAVVTIVSFGNGAKAMIEANVASLGTNIVTVFPGSFTTGGVRGGFGSFLSLTPEDATAIQQEVGDIDGVSAEIRGRAQVLANGLNWQTSINGESPDYSFIRNWPVAEGAMFSDQDVKSIAKVCVVGKTIVDQLYPDQDPIGQTLRIRNIPFRIVGVLAMKGFNINGQDQDDLVIIPYTSHMRRISRQTNINSILVAASSAEKLDKVKQDIEDLLTQRHKSPEPDFTVRTQEEIAAAQAQASQTMTGLLVGVAIVSLVVGGIGIMNIMLVSVTERTREIGIRVAIGAHGRDVLTQFLIEAIMLSSLGGIIGVLAGVGTSQFVAWKNGWPVMISTLSVFGSVGFSAFVGIIAGFYPAYKAAQLDPIDALRYE